MEDHRPGPATGSYGRALGPAGYCYGAALAILLGLAGCSAPPSGRSPTTTATPRATLSAMPSPTATSDMQAQTKEARLVLPATKDGKAGFINERGQVLISFDFDEALPFNEQMAPIRVGSLWGFVEASGTRVVEPRYAAARAPREGRAAVKEIEGKWGFIDASGTQVIAPDFTEARDFSQGLAGATKAQKWGFIDTSGKKIIDFSYDDVGDFRDGLAPVRTGKAWGYIDKTGNLVVPSDLAQARNFSEGLAAAQSQGKWGYLGTEGKFKIPPSFGSGQDMINNMAAVLKENRWGYLDKSGRSAIKPAFEEAGDFSDGLAPVKLEGRWMYINTAGEKAISLPEGVTKAESFQSGVARVTYRKVTCYICKTGEFVWNPISGKQEGNDS